MADLPELSLVPVAQSGGTKAKPLKVDEDYLHTHPKTKGLYFRRGFPAPLRPYILGNRTELKVTLGSKSVLTPGVAEKFWAASSEYDNLYARAVKLKEGAFDRLEESDILRLAEVYHREALEEDDAARWDPEERNLYKSSSGPAHRRRHRLQDAMGRPAGEAMGCQAAQHSRVVTGAPTVHASRWGP